MQKFNFMYHQKSKDSALYELREDFTSNIYEPAAGLKGSDIKTSKVVINTFTEFDPIESLIVGHMDETSTVSQGLFDQFDPNFHKIGQYPQTMISCIQEDQEKIVEKLQQLGIKVFRVGKKDFSKEVEIHGQKGSGFTGFNARDNVFTYHDSLYEFPSGDITTAFDFEVHNHISKRLHENGSKIWRVSSDSFEKSMLQEVDTWEETSSISADAANLLRVGLDILFLISPSGSYGHYQQFGAFMKDRYDGKVRVHPVIDVYDGIHIDTNFLVLGFNKKIQKNLVLVNGLYVTKQNMPALFRGENWRVIEVKEFESEGEDYPQYFIASECIGMNMLVINPHLVMMSQNQIKFRKTLQFYGIECIPVQHRYPKQIAGSIHCMTNEISREDTYGFKRILEEPTKESSKEQLAGLFDAKLLELLSNKESDTEKWVELCNQNSIFPTYLTDHL